MGGQEGCGQAEESRALNTSFQGPCTGKTDTLHRLLKGLLKLERARGGGCASSAVSTQWRQKKRQDLGRRQTVLEPPSLVVLEAELDCAPTHSQNTCPMCGCVCPQHLGVCSGVRVRELRPAQVNCLQLKAQLICQILNAAPFLLIIAFVWIKIGSLYF